MEKVKLEIGWKLYSLIIGLFVLVGYLGFSYAYGGTNPGIMGHSASEIEGVCRTDGTGCPEPMMNPQSITSTGITFINPITVATSTNSKTWKAFDASSYIPENANGVILETEISGDGTSDGQNDLGLKVLIRKDQNSQAYILSAIRTEVRDNYRVKAGGQGIFPIDSNKKFEYRIESSRDNSKATIRLIGYF